MIWFFLILLAISAFLFWEAINRIGQAYDAWFEPAFLGVWTAVIAGIGLLILLA